MLDFWREVKPFWKAKIRQKLQIDFLERIFFVLIELISRSGVGCVYASEFVMTHDSNGIKTSIGLTLECINEAVQIDCKVIPAALFPVGVGTLDEERFNLEFVVGR